MVCLDVRARGGCFEAFRALPRRGCALCRLRPRPPVPCRSHTAARRGCRGREKGWGEGGKKEREGEGEGEG